MTGPVLPEPDLQFLEPRHLQLAGSVADFLHDRYLPAGLDEDAPDAPRRCAQMLADAGVMDHMVPAAQGGTRESLELRSICVVREKLAHASGLADLMFIMQGLGSHPLLLAGEDGPKDRFLSGLRTGREIAAIGITEPGAGSDLGAIAVTARRDGPDYVLDGEKIYISNAGHATFYSLLARTGTPEEGREGLSFLLLEADRPGLTVEPLQLLSPHPIGRLILSGCRVPADRLLGAEGQGFDLALRTLNFFRPTVGAAAVGFAARALDEALDHVRERVQFGRTLSKFQGIQHQLADMATEIDASRLLVLHAAAEADAGRGGARLSSMAKLYSTECASRVVDAAVQMLGARGLVVGAPVERLYREVRALRIYEGTSEIQRNLIAREILRS